VDSNYKAIEVSTSFRNLQYCERQKYD